MRDAHVTGGLSDWIGAASTLPDPLCTPGAIARTEAKPRLTGIWDVR